MLLKMTQVPDLKFTCVVNRKLPLNLFSNLQSGDSNSVHPICH